MPVKILLADKSITIQKVVEMLFSGKEYEVACVSDGDTALGEASRIVPDVILADVDLPRLDGYRFAGRLKDTPALAKVPVILMLSRDDVYDAGKGKQAGIVDNIAKPFESQDLIGKVKKALAGAPAGTPPSPATAAAVQKAAPVAPLPPPTPKTQQKVPSDIFDIIQEASAQPAVRATPAAPAPPKEEKVEEEMFDVEPEFEVEPEREPEKPAPAGAKARDDEDWAALAEETSVEMKSNPMPGPTTAAAPDAFDTDQLFGREHSPAEESGETTVARKPHPAGPAERHSFEFGAPLSTEEERVLPLGQKAMDEMREGLGLAGDAADESARHPDIVSFESLDMASRASHEDYLYTAPVVKAPPATQSVAAPEPSFSAPSRAPEVSDEMLKGIAREAIGKAAREVLERVAWEVIPDLAERLIREEIERLKAEK